MARSRNIKPGFFGNDLLAEIDPLGRLLFIGLWTVADREGRMEDRPKRIKAAVLPFDNCDIDALLGDLSRLGFIVRYQAEGGRYIQIVNWHKHQNPHLKEAPSYFPAWNQEDTRAPDEHHTSTIQAPNQHHTSPADSGFLIPDSGFKGNDQQRGATTVGGGKARCSSGAGLVPAPDSAASGCEETSPPGENPPGPEPSADPVTVRAVGIAVLLRARGAGVAAGDPRLRSWAVNGVTDAALLAALEVAERRRSDTRNPQPVNAGLLDAILADGPPRAGPVQARDQQRTSWTQQANPRIAARSNEGGNHEHSAGAAADTGNVVTIDAVACRVG